MWRRLVYALLFETILKVHVAQEYNELRLLGMLPISGTTGWNGGAACLPAIDMALTDINNNSDLLDGYNLTYKWLDTQVRASILRSNPQATKCELELLCKKRESKIRLRKTCSLIFDLHYRIRYYLSGEVKSVIFLL